MGALEVVAEDVVLGTVFVQQDPERSTTPGRPLDLIRSRMALKVSSGRVWCVCSHRDRPGHLSVVALPLAEWLAFQDNAKVVRTMSFVDGSLQDPPFEVTREDRRRAELFPRWRCDPCRELLEHFLANAEAIDLNDQAAFDRAVDLPLPPRDCPACRARKLPQES